MKFTVGIGPNNRKSCYFDATVADGVQSFSVYNHMFIPAHFGDPGVEYERLMTGVAMWDVAAQRQVEISHNNGTQAQVVSGLSEGEQVVIYPSAAIQDGTAITRRVVE